MCNLYKLTFIKTVCVLYSVLLCRKYTGIGTVIKQSLIFWTDCLKRPKILEQAVVDWFQQVGFIYIIIQGISVAKSRFESLLFVWSEVQARWLSCMSMHSHMEARLQVSGSYGVYLPSTVWHCGQEWVISFMLSMQNGIRQQGQHPTRQRITVSKARFIY